MQETRCKTPSAFPAAQALCAGCSGITTMKRAGVILPMQGRVGKGFVIGARGVPAGEGGQFLVGVARWFEFGDLGSKPHQLLENTRELSSRLNSGRLRIYM